MVKRKPNSSKHTQVDRSFEELLEEALAYIEDDVEDGNGERAEPIFRKLLVSGYDRAEVRFGLANALFLQGRMLEGDDEVEHAIRLAQTEDEKAQLLAAKAQMVLTEGYPEAALQAFYRIDEEYPQYVARYSSILAMILLSEEKEMEAWKWFEARLAKAEELPPLDVAFYAKGWLELVAESGRAEYTDKLTRLFKRAVAQIANADERHMLAAELAMTAAMIAEESLYQEAEWFIDWTLFTDPSSANMVEAKREVRQLVAVQREMERMSADDRMFPLVTIQACEWFYPGDEGEVAAEMLADLPEEFIDMLHQDRQGFVDGIKRLKSKYKAVYEFYKQDWDELYEEKVGGSGSVIHLPRR